MQITEIIQKTPGVSGGHACVRNTRVAVWTLASLRQQGATEQELLKNYPGLSLEDWGYYYNNKSEIDFLINSIED